MPMAWLAISLLRGCAVGLLGVWTVKRTIRITLMRDSMGAGWLAVNQILIYFSFLFWATRCHHDCIGRQKLGASEKRFFIFDIGLTN